MSDIVERLRAEDGWVCNEAADEIDRLRGCQEGDAESIKFLAAEIERLRAALNRLMAQPTQHPLAMAPDERKELWAAHEEARRALEPKP